MGQGDEAAQDSERPGRDERAQDRWQRLLQANRAVLADLSLEGILTGVIEAACELVGAPYGAIGVIGPGGDLFEQFVYVGIDSDEAHRIGHLPEGKGLLGALIDDPSPIRLRDLRDDVRSVGFPPSHPPMRGFLGVPIRVRGEIFGNLYLASLADGDFDEEDEQLAMGLAATAGVAIENARLYAEARHRQRWLEASTDITRRVLTGQSDDALRVIGEQVAELADADLVTVALPAPDGPDLQVGVAVGMASDRLMGFRYSLPGTISQRVVDSGETVVFDDVGALRPPSPVLMVSRVVALGPVMVVPLSGTLGVRGVLIVGRRPGRRPFGAPEVDMATNFAYHASVALELADARHEAQRMLLMEDRARIARDLHDHVIQQLFAAGMTLQASLPRMGQGAASESVDRVVDIIDDAIRQIRSSIFQLSPRTILGAASLRSAVLAVVAEATPVLGWEPSVLFGGAVDSVADDALLDDVTAVVRESLSNVARHAGAGHAEVSVTVRGPMVVVMVQDDGVGVGSDRRSGLANLRQRAEERSGTLEVGPAEGDRGTRVTWSARFDQTG